MGTLGLRRIINRRRRVCLPPLRTAGTARHPGLIGRASAVAPLRLVGLEIEGAAADAFSAGGDSGSLIVDEDHKAVALLFAGGDVGGANGKGLTYANPIRAVLDALKLELLY
jgi:hypothetical protein